MWQEVKIEVYSAKGDKLSELISQINLQPIYVLDEVNGAKHYSSQLGKNYILLRQQKRDTITPLAIVRQATRHNNSNNTYAVS